MRPTVRRLALLILLGLLTFGMLFLLGRSNTLVNYFAGQDVPPIGRLLDPTEGILNVGQAHLSSDSLNLEGLLQPVRILRDERSVPHIFAETDQDAIMALGYVMAQDRLFQLDFLPRVASGRLSEAFGPEALGRDRFLRSTGMDWGAKRLVDTLSAEASREWEAYVWYAQGVNAYLDRMRPEDLPFEMKLLGYEPDRFSPLQSARILQLMAYDLTYYSDDAGYAKLQANMNNVEYEKLFPQFSRIYQPVIPNSDVRSPYLPELEAVPMYRNLFQLGYFQEAMDLLAERKAFQDKMAGTLMEGYIEGKGSNNWAVNRSRSATGAPILANDMHLSLNLPAIWYEVHLITPNMNVYGVTIPGSPLPVAAFNDHVGWGFTNSGIDLIDHYALQLDETGTQYRYNGGWRGMDMVPDTIYIKGEDPVVDTLRYAHWGPVQVGEEGALAIQWIAHKTHHNLEALWGMNQAQNIDEFQNAIQNWHTTPQNIIYADVNGNIAIRTTGHIPIRKGGHGKGLLDGSTDAFEWTGYIPFDELPFAQNPRQQFLASANQQQIGPRYRYYLRHDWNRSYRSLRINTLLESKPAHTVDDLKRYQSDVHTVQHDLFIPLLDTLRLTGRSDTLRRMLRDWNGDADLDRFEPLILDEFLHVLEAVTWDEFEDEGTRKPRQPQLYYLLTQEPTSVWLDVQETKLRRETAGDVLAMALAQTADSLEAKYGWDPDQWKWGDNHKVVFRHLTRNASLRSLWRGPYAYPGFASTLSPANSRPTTFSASWRVVMDFSQQPPVAYGVYPGGQSGNPASPYYDAHIETYLNFQYFNLRKPNTPADLHPEFVSRTETLVP